MKEPEEGQLKGARNGIKEVCKEGRGCPNGVYKLAKTKWQKEVGLEFMHVHEKIQELKNDTKWCKYIMGSIFLVVALDILLKVV